MKQYIPYFVSLFSIIAVLFIWTKKPQQIFKTRPVKVIERQIEKELKVVHEAARQTEVTKKELTYYKSIYDTVHIVQYQDSVIHLQDTQIVYLNKVVDNQDTIIKTLEFDVKRIRRQRNLSFLANGILGTILILKK